MVSGGSRVSICRSPAGVVATGVFTEIALEPMAGASGVATTFIRAVPAARCAPVAATTAMSQVPGVGRSTFAT